MVKLICHDCKRQKANLMYTTWCACQRFIGRKRNRDGTYVYYDLYAEPEDDEEVDCRSRKCHLDESTETSSSDQMSDA